MITRFFPPKTREDFFAVCLNSAIFFHFLGEISIFLQFVRINLLVGHFVYANGQIYVSYWEFFMIFLCHWANFVCYWAILYYILLVEHFLLLR